MNQEHKNELTNYQQKLDHLAEWLNVIEAKYFHQE